MRYWITPACYNMGHFIFTNIRSGWEWVRDRQTEIGRQNDRQGKTEKERKKEWKKERKEGGWEGTNRSKREEKRGSFINHINSLRKRRQCQTITTPVIKIAFNMFYRPLTYIRTFAWQEIFIRHACAHLQMHFVCKTSFVWLCTEIVFQIWPETHFMYCPWALQMRSMWTLSFIGIIFIFLD